MSTTTTRARQTAADRNAETEPLHQERRTRLIDAALGVFARHGFGGGRVDQIAEAAAMNKRFLYQYVGDKEALFAAAANRALERLARADPEGAGDPEAWRMLGQASVSGRCPDLTTLVLTLGHEGGVRPESVSALLEEVMAALLPELESALRAAGTATPKPRIKLRPRIRPRVNQPIG